MRNVFLLVSLIMSFSSFSQSYKIRTYSFDSLDRIEKDMEKWVEKVGEKDLLIMGKMMQKPTELNIVRYFFPYLLPKDFLTYYVDMSCAPAFYKFREKKDSSNFDEWEHCVQALYRKEIPQELAKALKDLRPKK